MSVVKITAAQVTPGMKSPDDHEAEFGVKRSTMDKWVRQGRLTKYKLGFYVLFETDDVAALVAELRGDPEVFVEKLVAMLKGGPELNDEHKRRVAVAAGIEVA